MKNKNNYVTLTGSNLIAEWEDEISNKKYTELPAGIYNPHNVGGLFKEVKAFEPIELDKNLVSFKDGAVADAAGRLEKFFSKEYINAHKKLGVSHKAGMLLYGPPGTGKTSCAFLIMQNLIKDYNAICINATQYKFGWIKSCISHIRKHQDNPIVIFVDEFEQYVTQNEQALLVFLDGIQSIDKCLFIGCTNFLSKIPDRIKNRPSRIKHLIEINRFPDAVYKQYIQTKIKGIKNNDLAKYVVLCGEAKLTIDQVKHVLINVEIEGMKVEDAVKQIQQFPVDTEKIEDGLDEND